MEIQEDDDPSSVWFVHDDLGFCCVFGLELVKETLIYYVCYCVVGHKFVFYSQRM